MKTIAQGRREQSQNAQPTARGVASVASDLDKLLGPKSLVELEKLEKQINTKLSSNEPIDTDYWQHLLKSLLTYKARAKLRKVSKSVLEARLEALRKQQAELAAKLGDKLAANLANAPQHEDVQDDHTVDGSGETRHNLDPEPLLRLRTEDKAFQSMEEAEFAENITQDRGKVLKRGYIPEGKRANGKHGVDSLEPSAKRMRLDAEEAPSVFDREVARGLSENEEVFTAEEPVTTKNLASWLHLYRPRKPKYFNRVVKGYEWNKYNQTHYDHDNPPPKVVQGYKFNVFFPDLVDKTKAPTYRIERENGRRRGQTFAPAGEDDTCLIRFTAGPPYEDVAFRIIDREWDYSAKRERGFKSSFDKVSGVLKSHCFVTDVNANWFAGNSTVALWVQKDILQKVTPIGLKCTICTHFCNRCSTASCLTDDVSSLTWLHYAPRSRGPFRQNNPFPVTHSELPGTTASIARGKG